MFLSRTLSKEWTAYLCTLPLHPTFAPYLCSIFAPRRQSGRGQAASPARRGVFVVTRTCFQKKKYYGKWYMVLSKKTMLRTF